MSEFSVVGKSVIRVDAWEKATGQAVFTSDIRLPGMLYARVLRSPHPHARIISIDTSRAERMPGVVCVITGKDVPDRRFGEAILDQYVLARDRVRAVGDPVVAVAAETRDAAEEALDLISVVYEPLPAVFDPEVAMSTDPPAIIHPDLPRYEAGIPSQHQLDPERPNVFRVVKIRHGDVEKGFREADLVMENRFSVARIQHCALEPHGVVVQPGLNGELTIWTNKNLVQRVKGQLSRLFDIDQSKVRAIQVYIGGGFGGMGALHEEPVAVQLALKTGRPVKLVFSREEVFMRGGTREPMIIYIKDGVTRDGRITARQMMAILAGGGYGESFLGSVTRAAGFATVGVYKIPNLKWDSYGVYVNEPPATAFRGFGNTEVLWAVESHMDMLAEKLGMDPVEIRRINLLHEGDVNATGEIVHSIGVEECLDKVVEFIKPKDKPESEGAWRKGKGIAIGSKYSRNPSWSMARVKVMEDGGVVVYHGAEELGQGCDTVMAQIAAEEFGIAVDRVQIALSDTLYIPPDYGTVSSRATYQTGNAVRLACQDAKRQIFQRSAPRLGEVSPDDLETRGGVVYVRGFPDKKISIAELFVGYSPGHYGNYTENGEILGNVTYAQPYAPEDRETGQIDPVLAARGLRLNAFFAYVAKAVEVAVNTETGEVKVLRCSAVADMGQPINPKICEQQAEGGIGMGIGGAIYEEVKIKEGVVMNPNFTDYRIPSVREMPILAGINIQMAPAPHKDGPFGAKGFAEATMIGMDAAIANAVYNAVGVRIKDLPMNAERVLKALKEKKETSG